MYGFIWRHLPGPTVVRVLLALLLVLAAIAVLFVWVFPALAPIMPFNNGTVNQ
jgi:phage shock protein PspC (stress-responsive transcriptional regulator)